MRDEVQNRHRLRKFAEELAPRLLEKAGFSHIQSSKSSLRATRASRLYTISLRSRNKFKSNGELNGSYSDKSRARAHDAWLAIQVDRTTYSTCFGTYQQLRELNLKGTGIIMTDQFTRHYEALAKDEFHNVDYRDLSNNPVDWQSND